MKKISAKEFMYVCAVIIFPVVLLFKGMFLYSIVGSIVSGLLISIDPLFRKIKIRVPETNRYLVNLYISGILIGVIIYFLAILKTPLVFAWFIGMTFYGITTAKKLEKLEKNDMGTHG